MTSSPHAHDEAAALLASLTRAGAQFWMEADNLRFRSPQGLLTVAHKAALRAHKSEIISLLRQELDHAIVLAQEPDAEAVWVASRVQASIVANPDAHNVDCSFPWYGAIDAEAIQAALHALLERHSILRTRYVNDTRYGLLAVTQRCMPIRAAIIDLRGSAAQRVEQQALEAYEAAIWKHFDALAEPLFTVTVVRLSNDYSTFVVVAHHSICDGTSQSIVRSDFAALYQAALEGTSAALPLLTMEYRDHVREQQRWLESDAVTAHLDFWRSIFKGTRSVFWLPYDRRDPASAPATPPDVAGEISGDSLLRLKQISRTERVSMFVLFVTLFYIVLARWSRRPDVASWICHFGRPRPQLRGIVGCFIDHWLLRVDLSGDPSFLEVLRRVQSAYGEAAPHIAVGLHYVAPELRQLNAGEMCPGIVVNYLPNAGSTLAPEGALPAGRRQRPPTRRGGFSKDSPLGIIINGGELEWSLSWAIRYSSHLFEEETIQRMSAAMIHLAGTVTLQPAEPLRALPKYDITDLYIEPPREA